MLSSCLPPELWIQVFRWATLSKSTAALCSTDYEPFRAASVAHVIDEALAVKCNLVLVCRQWRRLMTEFLYEDITILNPRRRSSGYHLKCILEGEESEQGYGRLVRRTCLPYLSSITENQQSMDALDILKFCCAQLEVLVRPSPGPPQKADELRFEFPAVECPPLPSLKRLDWWHHNDAARTGGINSLPDVLRAAPNLQFLSLGGEVWLGLMRTAPVELPVLTTLRLRRLNILFLQQICKWSLPSLKHVIVEAIRDHLEILCNTFGAQLRTVELGRALRYLTYDSIPIILRRCPNLEVLNYHVYYTAMFDLSLNHYSLKTIGLHLALPDGFFPLCGVSECEHFEGHLENIGSNLFPSLKRLVLYYDSDSVGRHFHHESLTCNLGKRGCAVQWEKV